MKKALSILTDNFATIRTGRANPAILDRIMVSRCWSSSSFRADTAQLAALLGRMGSWGMRGQAHVLCPLPT